jgi:hypothetical protein
VAVMLWDRACALIGAPIIFRFPLSALAPPASDPNSRMKGLTRGHDADRCICISQNFKDRRARAALFRFVVLGEIAPPVFLHQQGLDTTCS